MHRERASDNEHETPEQSCSDAENDSAGDTVETKESAAALQLADVMEGTRVPAGKFAFTLRNKALTGDGDILELEVLLYPPTKGAVPTRHRVWQVGLMGLGRVSGGSLKGIRRVLEWCWNGMGRVFEGYREGLGRYREGLGMVLEGFGEGGRVSGGFWNGLGRVLAESRKGLGRVLEGYRGWSWNGLQWVLEWLGRVMCIFGMELEKRWSYFFPETRW